MTAVQPILTFISGQPKLEQYLVPLKHVVFTTLLMQLGEIYSTMRFVTLQKLIPFLPEDEVLR